MHQVYRLFNSNSTYSPYAIKTSCWIQILKLQTLGNLWSIPSHYLDDADNYNKEKVINTKKISPTTSINETTTKNFLYFRDNVFY